MMNQDQYHASLLNKGQPVGVGWDGITKASKPKVYPQDPPNMTDIDLTIKQVRDNDPKLIDLNWNNIKVTYFVANCFLFIYYFVFKQNISDEKFEQLFEGLGNNTHLETLSLTNVGLADKNIEKLAEAIEKNATIRVLNVETNFISPNGIVRLVKALLEQKTVEEFRATNQVNISFFNLTLELI